MSAWSVDEREMQAQIVLSMSDDEALLSSSVSPLISLSIRNVVCCRLRRAVRTALAIVRQRFSIVFSHISAKLSSSAATSPLLAARCQHNVWGGLSVPPSSIACC